MLLASLLYAVSYVSNTSGVFKGFHRGWGGRTGTALYRILSASRLCPPVFFDNGLDNRADAAGRTDAGGELRGQPLTSRTSTRRTTSTLTAATIMC